MSASPDEDKAKPNGTSAEALATSAPDDSSTLLKMLHRVERLGPQWLSALIIGTAVMFWTVVRFGGDLAIKIFPMAAEIVRGLHDGKSAEQAAQDRQILEGLHAIDGKLDAQGQRIDQLGGDVRELRGKQASTEARVRALVKRNEAEPMP